MKPAKPATLRCETCRHAPSFAVVRSFPATAADLAMMEREGWLRMPRKGGKVAWLCPGCRPMGPSTPVGGGRP